MKKKFFLRFLVNIFICFAFLASSCSNLETSDIALDVDKTDTIYEASTYEIDNVDSRCVHFYEHKHLTNEDSFTDNSSDFEEPYSYEEVTSGVATYNGAAKSTTLNITSEDGEISFSAYKNPANLFDFASYSVSGSSVTLTYKFISSSNDTYKSFDCGDTSLDGFSLGGKIGVGSVIMLVRTKDASSWTKKGEWLNISSGGICKATISGDDIKTGVYIRFVSAYQNRAKDGQIAFTSYYRFYDYLQRTTIFLGRSGSSLQILSSSTPNQTHTLSNISSYEGNVSTSSLVELEKVDKPSLGAISRLADFFIEGEFLSASETNYGIETNSPIYVYNGIEGNMKVSLDNRFNLVSSSYSLINVSSDMNITTPHDSDDIIVSETTLLAFGSGGFFLQGYIEEETCFETISYVNDVSQSDYNLNVSINDVKDYSLLRVVYAVEYQVESIKKLELCASYFSVIDGSNYSSSTRGYESLYEVKEGTISTLNAFQAGLTLEDESVSFSSIIVYNPGGYTAWMAHNDEDYVELDFSNGSLTYSDEGTYLFKTLNNFGETEYTKIYIFGIGSDNGVSRFFEPYDGHLLSETGRVYCPNSLVPVYASGTLFKMEIDDTCPPVSFELNWISSDGETTISNEKHENIHGSISGSFSKPGLYQVEIDIGNPSVAGDHLHYTVSFSIVDTTDGSYTPIVNNELLHGGYFGNSFYGKVYLVSISSAGEGKVNFVYPYTVRGYNDALSLAIKDEYLTKVTNVNSLYKYLDVSYTSKFKLYTAMKEVAASKVQSTVLSQNVSLSDNEQYDIDNVYELSLSQDIYVVEDETILSELIVDPVYINGYSFVQLREYESESVTMISHSQEEISIPYGEIVDSYLNESGIYKVIEKNAYGTSTYNVAFAKEGEVGTSFLLKAGDDEIEINQIKANSIVSNYSSIEFTEIADSWDPYDVITVSCGDEKYSYLMEELEGKIIDCDGIYTIKATNRIGYSYSFQIRISGGSGNTFLPHEYSLKGGESI